MNTQALAKEGFTLIRNLLEGRVPGGHALALKVSEALHNLPEPGNDFLVNMICENVTALADEYDACQCLLPYL